MEACNTGDKLPSFAYAVSEILAKLHAHLVSVPISNHSYRDDLMGVFLYWSQYDIKVTDLIIGRWSAGLEFLPRLSLSKASDGLCCMPGAASDVRPLRVAWGKSAFGL